ncbi:unnamed protein product [Ranitomeya imitator]|uniref:Tc1-like transposase DDE domain-containing protein n=1 Tax=Ranitomeya imitator TaxID=111125 RepID=A0ABN9KQ66_9NEOB|nr:unnamed protein product [Ranitomeya imitator]
MAFNGTGSLVFIDDIRADKSSRMNSEVDRDILSAQIQPNAAKLIGRRFIVQMDNDPKHTSKATQEFMSAKKWNILQWPSQSPDLNPIEHAFHLLKSRLKTERPTNKQDLKAAAVKAWQSIKKEETQRLVMSMGSRLKAYVLKHEKYRNLREVERYPNSLNPHNAETLPLIKAILTQILEKHPKSSWVHIGSDEVYHLGEGQDSKSWLNSNKGDLSKMFLGHVKNVVDFVYAQFPEKNQLMWDDMLRWLSIENIQASGITQRVSPVLWIYHNNFNMAQIESFISKYEKSGFTNIWFASAFKGASSANQMWTPMNLHAKNHQEWAKVVKTMSKFPKIHYSGIALTGWQRSEITYDHYSVLCELLPVGIPSLAVCLKTLKYGQFTEEAKKDIAHILGFSNINLEKNICEGTGAFPGAEIFNMVKKVHSELRRKVREITEEDSEISSWFSRYHRKHRFANPHKMETFSTKIIKANEEWESHIQALRSELDAIYFPDTVEEWMEENVNPYMDALRDLTKDFQEILPLYARPKVLLKK